MNTKKFKTKLRNIDRALLRYLKKRKHLKEGRNLFKKNGIGKTIDASYVNEVQKYWKENLGKDLNPIWHNAISYVTGQKEVRYLPHHLWFSDILPYLNNYPMRPAYIDKNLSEVFLNLRNKPETTIKRMYGSYYDQNHKPLSREEAWERIVQGPDEQIVKPSQTDNGVGVRAMKKNGDHITIEGKEVTIDELEKLYNNEYIIQKKIKQHELLSAPHPYSLNTIRLVTLRWNNEVHTLLSFARFGANQNITDNAGTGGILCGICERGILNSRAINENGDEFTKHPTSGYDFTSQQTIPNYQKLCQYGIELHKQIFHFNVISWDFAVNPEGEPVFLELNYQGASWLYQMASEKPLLGEFTTDILNSIKKNKKYRK